MSFQYKKRSMEKRFLLEILGRTIFSDLENIREHCDLMESSLKKELKNFSKRIDEHADKLSSDEKTELYEWYSDDYWRLADVFPNIQRSAMLIMAFSFFENQIKSLCKRLQPYASSNICLNDLRGHDVDQAKIYLKKIIKINFPNNDKNWEEITNFRDIRNLVVHNGGKPEKERREYEKLKKYIDKNNKLLKLDTHEKIVYKKEFIPHVLSTFQNFFRALLSEIEKNGIPLIKPLLVRQNNAITS